MYHDTVRNSTLRIFNRVYIDTSSVRIYVSRERHHRLQSNKEFARPEYSRRKLHRDLGGVGKPHHRHENTGFDFIMLLPPNFTDPEGISVEFKTETDYNNEILSVAYCFQYLKDRKVVSTTLKKFLWTVGTARNALVVVLSAIASYIFETHNGAPYVLTGHIDAGLPIVEPPPFSRTVGNQTENFIDMTKNFKFGILVVPLISIIGNVAIAKAFAVVTA